MNGPAAFQRGRILLPPLAATPRRHRTAEERGRFLLFLALLPFFGQVFHYVIDLPATYYLSKIWPLLALPLTLYGLIWQKLPYELLYATTLAYVLGIAPAMSMMHLGNALLDALATTVKVLPLTYYFSVSALLALLLPRPEQVKTAFLLLGLATFGLMALLWLTVPPSAYQTSQAETKLFIYDVERGPRIYMPMFFGMLLLFYLMRRFGQTRQLWLLLPLLLGLVGLVEIYKQRTAIAAALIVLAYGFVMSTRPRLRFLLISAGLLAIAAALAAWLSGSFLQEVTRSFGGSLSVRERTISLALEYLSSDPLRWLFGVGAITRFSTVTLPDIFSTELFFLADIGWIGVVFEYGLLGALLIAAIYLAALRTARQAARTKDPFAQALGDYVLYLFLTSPIYSAVFTPGEAACVMAIALYLMQRSSAAGAAHHELPGIREPEQGSPPARVTGRRA